MRRPVIMMTSSPRRSLRSPRNLSGDHNVELFADLLARDWCSTRTVTHPTPMIIFLGAATISMYRSRPAAEGSEIGMEMSIWPKIRSVAARLMARGAVARPPPHPGVPREFHGIRLSNCREYVVI